MIHSEETLIGHVIDVRGDRFVVDLEQSEQGQTPIVTIYDEDIAIGRLGTYVLIVQNELYIVGMIARMTEREKLGALSVGDPEEAIQETFAARTIDVVPVGTISPNGDFERGISQYPTTGAAVHAIGSRDVSTMFRRFQEMDFELCTLSSHPGLPVYLDPSSLFSRHFAVLGQTGAGKSWAVASIVQNTIRRMKDAHIIILDLHGEYKSAFRPEEARHLLATELELPYWLMTYSELCDLLIDRTEFSAHNQVSFFRDTLQLLKQAEGQRLGLLRTTVDTPVYFSLDSLRNKIQEKNTEMVPGQRNLVKGPLHGDFTNFLMRLDGRRNDVRYDFLLNPARRTSSESLEDLLRDLVGLGETRRPVTILDMSPVPFDVRPVVTAQVGRLVFEFNYWNPYYRQFPLLLICEEAHAYIGREIDVASEGARKSMERIAKEGRKYGVGIGVVSQRPHEVSETVLAQCGTFICLRITNPDDQAYIRKVVPEAERDLVDIFSGLRRGEAIILGEAAPVPSRVSMYLPDPGPASNDVEFRKYWSDMGTEDMPVAEIVDCWRKQSQRPRD